MITAKVLGAMPQFVLSELGERGLVRSLNKAYLPYQFLDQRSGYITEDSVATFIAETARQLGQEKLGLLFAPILTVADFGKWGAFVLSAPTLAQALIRTVETISLHATGDRAWLETGQHKTRLVYCFGARTHTGYPDVAYGTAGNFMSIPKHYISPNWRPAAIEFDFPKPVRAFEAAEALGCPVRYNADNLAIVISNADLATPLRQKMASVTYRDIVRENAGGPPNTYTGHVSEIMRMQLIENRLSVERTASILDTGVRTLQRRLNSDGLTFRDLTNRIRLERSTELLHLEDQTITSISNALGYSSPNSFTRAFKSQTGLSPRAYRKSIKR